MAAPLVSWRSRDNSAQVTSWDIGEVDAGTVSNDFGFLIWNNYAGATDVADMEDVVITVKDEFGGNTGDLVIGQWIEVKNDTMGEVTFTPIGYDELTSTPKTHPVYTDKSTVFNGVTSTPNVAPHTSTNGTVSILGVANDGTKINSAGNFVELTLHARVPGNASAGLIRFLTRISFRFVS